MNAKRRAARLILLGMAVVLLSGCSDNVSGAQDLLQSVLRSMLVGLVGIATIALVYSMIALILQGFEQVGAVTDKIVLAIVAAVLAVLVGVSASPIVSDVVNGVGRPAPIQNPY